MKGCHVSHRPPLHCHQPSTAMASPWHRVPRGDSPSHSPASASAHSCAFGNIFFWRERERCNKTCAPFAGWENIPNYCLSSTPLLITGNNCSFFFFLFLLLLSLFNIILSNCFWQRKTETRRKILHTPPHRWEGKGSCFIQVSRNWAETPSIHLM